MVDLNSRLQLAKADCQEMDRLIEDYLPFIKKEAARFDASPVDYQDRVSVGLLAFMNCIRQYQPSRGNFLTYAGVAIRNRIRDEIRRASYHSRNITYFNENAEEGNPQAVEVEASFRNHRRIQEQNELAEEIAELTRELAVFGISFEELAEISPKQKRSRKICHSLAMSIVNNEDLRQNLYRTRRLPTTYLIEQFHLSIKTIDKYRRYIIALTVILSGEYPSVRAFIPAYWEEEK